MTISQTTATPDGVLAFIDESVRTLQQDGLEPRTILAGPVAYEHLRHAIARQFNRAPGLFETYQYLDVVLDPFRGDEVCVVPAPRALADGVRTITY